MISELLEKISACVDLDEDEANKAMHAIMSGDLTPAQIAAFLMGLKMKGETVEEITGFVRAMRDKATRIDGPSGLVDTCGTGGDGSGTFNISTAAAIVAAAAGIPVAKHGNKSVSSKCGSADVLQDLGVKIDLTPAQAKACLQEIGIAFLFAPIYHASMKHVAAPRREIGIRTVFNILGPMSNPAGVKRQVIGSFNLDTAEKMIHVLNNTGSEHVLVVHSIDGLDEISLCAETHVKELKNGAIQDSTICPEDFGLQRTSIDSIKGGDVKANSKILNSVLDGRKGPHLDVTSINAGAAIYVGGKADSLKEGADVARDTILLGKAKRKIEEFIEYTQNVSGN